MRLWNFDQNPPPSPSTSSAFAPSNRATVKNTVKTSLILLEKAVDGLNIPGLKGAAGSIVEVIKIAEKRKQNKDALDELVGYLRRLEDAMITPLLSKQELGVSIDLEARVRWLALELITLANDWKSLKASHKRIISFVDHEDYTLEITKLNRLIKESLDAFALDNQIAGAIVGENTNITVAKIEQQQLADHIAIAAIEENTHITMSHMEKQQINKIIQDLPHANAAYNSISRNNAPTCFEGTRTNVLENISVWANDEDSPGGYVLVGIAGVGKTTIAQTLAEREATTGRLAATYFFSRDVNERNKADLFFCTIAYQLALNNEDFANRITRALQKSPDAPYRTVPEQLQKLIVEPLQDVQLSESHPALIVLDALDECEEAGASQILALLLDYLPLFKILITTRPEPHIMAVLNSHQRVERLVLHEVDNTIVESDIRRYLEHNLADSEVQKSVPGCKWMLKQEDLDALVEGAGQLFIVASTAEKFIKDKIRRNPRRQLQILLQGFRNEGHLERSPFATLDGIYQQILDSALPLSHTDTEMTQHFQAVVGTIIVLQNPLPTRSLALLLGFDDDDVKAVLDRLQSVIVLSNEDQTPRMYHPSFPDFMVNSSRCKEEKFLIDPVKHHSRLASQCFELMNGMLRRNICDIPIPDQYLENAKIPELELKIAKHIPAELAYACCYWAVHLDAADCGAAGLLAQLESFAFGHLLFWLEVLSLTGNIRLGYTTLLLAQNFAASQGASSELLSILHDGQRLIMANQEIIKTSALHVYYSALPFTPTNTTLFKTYANEAKRSVIVLQGVGETWDPLLAVLGGHTDGVTCTAFTSDGKRLASGSWDNTVRLWDGVTGAHIVTMEGHSGGVISLAFSPDGKRLASGSWDNTVRLWDGETGVHIVHMDGHHGGITSLTFNPDGRRVASGSWDYTVRMWDGETGEHVVTMEGHYGAVSSLAFSPDGKRLVSGSDLTMRLWDGATGEHIVTMEGHSQPINSVAFSPDGKRLASGSWDMTVMLWDGETGAHVVTILGHSKPVISVTFTSDGKRFASGSWDRSVMLWDGVTGAHIVTMNGHSQGVRSLTFSSDGTRLASGSWDKTVRLWDGETGEHIVTMEGHSEPVSSLSFSPDGKRLASGSDDRTVILWDGASGAHVVTTGGHSERVSSLAFSPDGERIASASSDKTVKLWNGGTGAYITTLRGHSYPVIFVQFTSGGSRLDSVSYHRIVDPSLEQSSISEAIQWDVATATKLSASRTQSRLSDGVIPLTASGLIPQSSSLRLVNRNNFHAVLATSSQASAEIPICLLPLGSSVASTVSVSTHVAVGMGNGRLFILYAAQALLD